ncbi:hypothetical protein BJV74DRAFT_861353 [Russula compacta]|nr:hypothetical protein BJV74DRAFT_861353 [Russula compacta]
MRKEPLLPLVLYTRTYRRLPNRAFSWRHHGHGADSTNSLNQVCVLYFSISSISTLWLCCGTLQVGFACLSVLSVGCPGPGQCEQVLPLFATSVNPLVHFFGSARSHRHVPTLDIGDGRSGVSSIPSIAECRHNFSDSYYKFWTSLQIEGTRGNGKCGGPDLGTRTVGASVPLRNKITDTLTVTQVMMFLFCFLGS